MFYIVVCRGQQSISKKNCFGSSRLENQFLYGILVYPVVWWKKTKKFLCLLQMVRQWLQMAKCRLWTLRKGNCCDSCSPIQGQSQSSCFWHTGLPQLCNTLTISWIIQNPFTHKCSFQNQKYLKKYNWLFNLDRQLRPDSKQRIQYDIFATNQFWFIERPDITKSWSLLNLQIAKKSQIPIFIILEFPINMHWRKSAEHETLKTHVQGNLD